MPKDREKRASTRVSVTCDGLSTVVQRVLGRNSDDNEPPDELPPDPDQDEEYVAIVVDGLGSSSAHLFVDKVIQWIEDEPHFKPCVFSYRGFGTRGYHAIDTVTVGFDFLANELDKYVYHYSKAKYLVLIGYSLGGLIVSEWIYRNRDNIYDWHTRGWDANKPEPGNGFVGTCFVASPLRVSSTSIRYDRTEPQPGTRGSVARGRISDIVGGYTAEPKVIPLITPMVVLRCERDTFLDDSLFTYEDLPDDERPVEIPIPDVVHDTIQRDESITRGELIAAITALCEQADGTR